MADDLSSWFAPVLGTVPQFYSFRRCPYAMRARMAIAYSNVVVELREILLKEKPQEMLALSPKGTVPVLRLVDGHVIDESREIIDWALQQCDPDDWQFADNPESRQLADLLIDRNDSEFKPVLDRYKYSVRFPEQSAESYREQGMDFLRELDQRLSTGGHLVGRQSIADVALMPFVRQFAMVDLKWFERQPLPALQQWLKLWLESELFLGVMNKYPCWQPGSSGVQFPRTSEAHS